MLWVAAMRTSCQISRNLLSCLAASVIVLAIASSFEIVAQESPRKTSGAKDSPEIHLASGYEALRQDRYSAAVDEFRAALEIDPSLTLRARFPLAVALFELKRVEESRKEFQAVQREAGEHPNVSYYVGRLDIEEQNFEGAIRNLSRAMEKPPFPDTSYYLGYAYFKHGDLADAEKALKQALEAIPNDARVPYQLGQVLRKEGKDEEAKAAVAQSSEQRKRDSSLSELRIACSQKLDSGDRNAAHAICDQLYDPNDAENLTELGTLYATHGDTEAALKPLRRAAELSPQSPQMQYNLALAYYQLKRFSDAQVPLAGALKRWPDLFQLNALYGAVLLELGELERGYATLHHAHELNPEDAGIAELLYRAALALAQKGQQAQQYTESLRYLEEAARLRPKEPTPHQKMAEIYTLTARTA